MDGLGLETEEAAAFRAMRFVAAAAVECPLRAGGVFELLLDPLFLFLHLAERMPACTESRHCVGFGGDLAMTVEAEVERLLDKERDVMRGVGLWQLRHMPAATGGWTTALEKAV